MLKIGVLGSGKGSNFQSIVNAVQSGKLDAEVVCVLSDHEDAYILERARNEGYPAHYIDCAPLKTKLEGAGAVAALQLLHRYGADCVVLAGFMRIVKEEFLREYQRRIINIHPSLLPAFPGLDSWKQALEYGAKVTGCTVHFVDEGMDTGPIILQRCVPVYDNDTPEVLHARIQEQEHIAYPEALQRLAEGKIHFDGRRVLFQ